MQSLRKYLKMKFVGSLLVIFVVTCIFHFGILLAAYNSSDVIGQTDGSGGADYVGGTRNDGIATNSNFGIVNPGGIAFDPTGQKIFIADSSANRILVFNTDAFGAPIDHYADAVLGQQDFYGYSSGTTSATLNNPEDVEFDGVRNYLYVSDSNNNRVLVFDVSTVTTGESAVKVLGQPDFVTSDFNVTVDGMGNPNGIDFFDSTQDLLFVADFDSNRVLVFNIGTDTSGVTTGQSASRVLGQSDFVSFANATTASGLYAPADIVAFNDGTNNYLFVADSGNNRVVMYDIDGIVNGENGVLFLGQPNATTANFDCAFGADAFCLPVSLDIQIKDGDYNLWVTDSGHNRVVGFSVKPIDDPLVEYVFGYTDETGATPGSTYFTTNPKYLNYFSLSDQIFVSGDNDHRVVVFDVSVPFSGSSAVDAYGQITDGNVDIETIANYFPFDNEISSTGIDIEGDNTHTFVDTVNHKMYVSDTSNNRVLVYNLSSSNIPLDRTADNVLGQCDFNSNSPSDNGSQYFNGPTGLALYDSGGAQMLFVSDTGNNRILVFNVTSITDCEPAVNVLGQINFTSSTPRLDDMGFTSPEGIDVTIKGSEAYLFVADTGSNRVLAYNVKTVVDGETAVAVLGQSDYATSTSGTSTTKMDSPSDVDAYLDAESVLSLFVSDTGNSRVLSFAFYGGSPVTNEVAQKVLGQTDFTTGAPLSTPSVTSSNFGQSGPRGLELNTNNSILYVADPEQNRVLGFDVSTLTDGEAAVSVFGQDAFTTSAASTTMSTFDAPVGVSVDTTNNKLYVTDSNNNRVLVYSLPFVVNVSMARVVWSNTTANYQGTLSAMFGEGVYPPGYKESSIIPQFSGFVTLNGTYSVVTQVLDTLVGVAGNFYANKLTLSSSISAPSEIASAGQIDAFTSRVDFGGYAGATNPVAIGYPEAIELDTTNNRLFVADTYNNRIMVFNLNSGTGKIDNYTPDYYLGQSNSSNTSAATTQAGLDRPTGMVFDSEANLLYVADSGNHRVVVYNAASLATGMNASYVLGQATYTASAVATTQSGMRFPQGLELDTAGDKLFVSDTGNNRVLVYDVATITNGENAQNVLGQASFTARVYAIADSNDMASPTELEFDQTNKLLYVLNEVSSGNSARILRYDTNSVSDNENATQLINDEGYYGIHGLGLDVDTETLYFSVNDPLNGASGQDVVYTLDLALLLDATENISPISLIGDTIVSIMDGDINDRTSSRMYEPRDMVVNSTTRELYVLDSGNKRVMVFDLVDLTTASLSAGTEGVAYSQNLTSINNQNNLVYRGENVAFAASDAIQDSDLPPGLALSSAGALSGTPTAAGTYTFTVRVYDTSGTLVVGNAWPLLWDKETYSLTINTASASTQCSDSIDNDTDGLTDYPADSGCSNANDDDETNSTGGGSSSACNDNLDNDGDGLTDFPDDPGCVSINDDEEENSAPQCGDSIDNDSDGLTDYPADPGCANLADNSELNTVVTECSDGIDNDSNGMIDYPDDLGCIDPSDSDEASTIVTPIEYVCSDSIDNDTDGLTDYPADSGCYGPTDSSETNVIIVTPPDDPVDDGGGGVDTEDPTEEEPPVDVEQPLEDEETEDEPDVLSEGGECFREITTVTPLGEVIVIQVEGTLCEVENIIDETTQYIKSVLNNPSGNFLVKIIAVVGLVMGAIFTAVPYLFLTPFSFSEVALLPYRLWSILMSIFGLKKQVRPWGTVYDSITKQPLDPAIVELLDLEGRSVATSTTDIDGRYGFLVGPGKYRLLPKKSHYAFPSLKLIGRTRDELYLDLYFGYVFEITKEGEVITKNIPMDPENFDWNEFAKNNQKKMRFFSRRDFIINQIADFLFSVGFVVTVIAIISAPTIYNIIIFSLYVITLILKEMGLKNSSFGSVEDVEGNPLSFAILKVKLTDGTEISRKVTNTTGRFYCLMQNGTYVVSIERKNPDESYTKVYEKIHQIKNGVLNGKIIVR